MVQPLVRSAALPARTHRPALSWPHHGNSLVLLDQIRSPQCEGQSSLVRQDKREHLTLYTQFNFPVLPLIDGIKAGRGKTAPAPS